MSTCPRKRWSTLLLAAGLLAAVLALATVPPIPSLAALTSFSDCQAGPDSKCCTCGETEPEEGEEEGEYFCHSNAYRGGVVCRDDGYCPRAPVCMMPPRT